MKRPIVCYPAIDWHYLFHRPQQLMLRLAEKGHPVHVRNPQQQPGAEPEHVAPNVWVYRDLDRLPPEVAEQAIYFIYFPAYAQWIEPGPGKFLVYDCIDDDPVFDGCEALMVERADLILCVSKSLFAKHQANHPRVVFLSNGVDLDHYRFGGGSVPAEIAELKKGAEAIIGFTGAFYRGWVDMELIYRVAYLRPRWKIVIIGESYQWDFSTAPKNLIYLGTRPYSRLPAYVRHFDVGWIPFLDNRIARGADPVKLYEYLAAGIPVVSRELPFTEGLRSPLVYTYRSPEECIAAIKRAVTDSKANRTVQRQRRQSFAAGHTWETKVEQLLAGLAKYTSLEG